MEELKSFYTSLGVEFQSEKHGKGPEHYAATLSNDLVLEIYPAADGTTPDTALRLGLSVPDLGDALRALGQSGAPRQTPWGLQAVVRDPDGRTVELLQSEKTGDNISQA